MLIWSMLTSFFGLNIYSGTPQVKRYFGLSSELIGTSFGTAESTSGSILQALNRVIQFGSQNTFLALVNNQVWRSTDAATTWTNVYSFSGSSGQCSGLNVIYINGIPTVCFIWNSAGSVINGSYSTDGITWTENSGFAAPSAIGALGKDTIYRNTLYVCPMVIVGGPSYATIIIGYTPGSPPFSVDVPAGQPPINASLCVFNDTLYYMSMSVVGATRRIYALNALTLQLAVTLIASGGTTTMYNNKSGMFVDSNSGDLIAFTKGSAVAPTFSSNTGPWSCFRISSSFVVTDISATVLPSGMLLATTPTSDKVLTCVDGEADPGTNPNKYIIYATAVVSTDPMTLYQWNGVSTTMSTLDSGGNGLDALTLSNNCQGVGFWTSGENSIQLINRAPSTTGMILSFKLYSTGNIGVVNIRAWFGTVLEEYPITAATLIGTTTGLTADGSTTYLVTWNNFADGISAGSRFRLIMEAYV